MDSNATLTRLTEHMVVIYGGNLHKRIDDDIIEQFRDGDELHVLHRSGDLLHIRSDTRKIVHTAVSRASEAFRSLTDVDSSAIRNFYSCFADLLSDDEVWQHIIDANGDDLQRARSEGNSTARLELGEPTRELMVSGLRGWADYAGSTQREFEHIDHATWSLRIEAVPLGVIGFVFEGRPNVFVDAAGVLATGNTAVMRIGSAALSTATAIDRLALRPALLASRLPAGAVSLVESRERAASWALFSDRRLALAVARGSGRAVATLSALALQNGIPVSAHGTGGAWLVADGSADPNHLADAIRNSLDRKVCNTLNTVVITRANARELVPVALAAADRAAADNGSVARIHVVDTSKHYLDPAEYRREIDVERADGVHTEMRATTINASELSIEHMWETTPEFSLIVADDLDDAIELVNRYSPKFVASLISNDEHDLRRFRARVDAPFIGDGFTRWVDGQYALDQPELGLSNWENGRLLGRGGILTGADLTTRRMCARFRNDT